MKIDRLLSIIIYLLNRELASARELADHFEVSVRMDKFCFSCTTPLANLDFQGTAENFCKYCTYEKCNLKPRAEIQMGIVEWFKMWQPSLNQEQATARVEHYMKAMPAWAD